MSDFPSNAPRFFIYVTNAVAARNSAKKISLAWERGTRAGATDTVEVTEDMGQLGWGERDANQRRAAEGGRSDETMADIHGKGIGRGDVLRVALGSWGST